MAKLTNLENHLLDLDYSSTLLKSTDCQALDKVKHIHEETIVYIHIASNCLCQKKQNNDSMLHAMKVNE